VSTEKQVFTIRASASRLGKGLLAIPQRFKDWFSSQKGLIQVVFDDEEKGRALTFHPFDPVVKENRIFGLAQWFSRRRVREGDVISVTLEDVDKRLYRIALDRYVREREEQKARHGLSAFSRIECDDLSGPPGEPFDSRVVREKSHLLDRNLV
jgi:hypothetical protein